MLSSLSIRAQLILSFLAISLMVVVASFMAIYSINAKGDIFSNYQSGVAARVGLANVIREAANSRAVDLSAYVFSGTTYEREAAKGRVLAAQERVEDTLQELQLAIANEPSLGSEQELLRNIASADSLYREFVQKTIHAMDAGRTDIALALQHREAYSSLIAMSIALESYLQQKKVETLAVEQAIEESIAQGIRNQVIVAVLAFFLALGFAFSASGRILTPLLSAVTELVAAVREVNTDMTNIHTAAAETLTVLSETSAVDRMTQQNAALVAEVAAASSAANVQAQALARIVQSFRL